MSRFGLVGGSYTSQSPNLDAEQCINLYVEQDESGAGNAPIASYSTPGIKTFVDLQVNPGGAGGYFDKAVTAEGNSALLAISATPTYPNETAFLLTVVNSDSTLGGATPGGSWSLLASNLEGNYQRLYMQTFASIAPVNVSEVIPSTGWAAGMAFFGNAGGVPPAVVQGKQIANTALSGAGSFSGALNSDATAGDGLLVIMAISAGSPYTAVSGATVNDTQGNLYYPIMADQNTAHRAGFLAFFAPNIKAGPTTITFAIGAGIADDAFISATEISGITLIPAPGKPIRGIFSIVGRTFAVGGGGFFEILGNGTSILWGIVSNDALPVTMAASPQQLLLASAGTAYVFDLSANTLTALPGATFDGPVSQAQICDDFFLLTIKDSKEFYVSAVLDAMDWVTNGSAIVSVFPDNIVSMLVFQRQIWFFSDTQSVVYYDSGNIFPFDVNPNAFIEAGCAAENSPAIFNNSIAWLGADARGHGKVWLASGYTPTRISNHAIEFAIQGYKRIDDAVGFAIQDQGHEFYCLYFPTPSVMWVYDANTGMWHQRGFWLESIGDFRAAHYQNHTFNFGRHLVGDWQSSKIYELHIPVETGVGWDFVTDDGNPIRRVRRAPHISQEQKRQFHTELQIYLESGLGPIPPLTTPGSIPDGTVVSASWSIAITPTPIPGTVDPGFGFGVTPTNLIVNGAANSSDTIGYYHQLDPFSGGAAILPDINPIWSGFGSQLYSGMEAAPTMLAGTYTLGDRTTDSDLRWTLTATINGSNMDYVLEIIPDSIPGIPRDPQIMMRFSDDGGHTWSNERIANCGQAGKYKTRVRFLQLGRARDRVYEISMSDPIGWRIIDGYLQIAPGTGI